MLETINRNILKFSAGRAITCPICGTIADCRRWIVASQGDTTRQCCATCWDKATGAKPVPASVEVLDGRLLFKGAK
jgi:hypothetical protein